MVKSGAGRVLMTGESCKMISGLLLSNGLKKLKTLPKSELCVVESSVSGFSVGTC